MNKGSRFYNRSLCSMNRQIVMTSKMFLFVQCRGRTLEIELKAEYMCSNSDLRNFNSGSIHKANFLFAPNMSSPSPCASHHELRVEIKNYLPSEGLPTEFVDTIHLVGLTPPSSPSDQLTYTLRVPGYYVKSPGNPHSSAFFSEQLLRLKLRHPSWRSIAPRVTHLILQGPSKQDLARAIAWGYPVSPGDLCPCQLSTWLQELPGVKDITIDGTLWGICGSQNCCRGAGGVKKWASGVKRPFTKISLHTIPHYSQARTYCLDILHMATSLEVLEYDLNATMAAPSQQCQLRSSQFIPLLTPHTFLVRGQNMTFWEAPHALPSFPSNTLETLILEDFAWEELEGVVETMEQHAESLKTLQISIVGHQEAQVNESKNYFICY